MEATNFLNDTDARPEKVISDQDFPHRFTVSAVGELPLGNGKPLFRQAGHLLNLFIGGWQIQGVYTFQKGFPVPFGTDGFWNGQGLAVGHGTTQEWFNTDAFTSVLNGTSTNASPLNHLRSLPLRFDNVRRDSINNLDLSLIKDVQFPGGTRAQLRAEFINALNQAYFPNPVVNPTSSTFGQVTSSNQSNYARRVQLGFKFLF